jgi:hypothetical protein
MSQACETMRSDGSPCGRPGEIEVEGSVLCPFHAERWWRRRGRESCASKMVRFIEESGRKQNRVAIFGHLPPPVLSKILHAKRRATEAQALQIAAGGLCDEREARLLADLLEERRRGAGEDLGLILKFHETTLEQVVLECGIAKPKLESFLANTQVPTPDEAMRIFAVAVVRDGRRRKFNEVLGWAGYTQLWPPLPPLRAA